MRYIVVLVAVAACGGSSPTPTSPTPAPGPMPAAATPISLPQIERIARGCVPGDAELYPTATWTNGTWSAEVRTGTQTVAIDAAASTCNGTKVEAAPVAGELSLDEVVAIAKQCHPDAASSISITYVVGEGAKQDRSHYEVGFGPTTAERTFPLPSYAVDPSGKTCGPSPGPHM